MSSIFGVPTARKVQIATQIASGLLSGGEKNISQDGVEPREFLDGGIKLLEGLLQRFGIPLKLDDPLACFVSVSDKLKAALRCFWAKRNAISITDISEIALAVVDEVTSRETDVDDSTEFGGSDDE